MEAKRFPAARCPACGGVCAFDPERGTSVCSACGHETEIPGLPCGRTEAHSAGELSAKGPAAYDGVAPAVIGRAGAAERMRKIIGKKLLCPSSYREGIEEGISPAYAPAWVFTGKMVVQYGATFGVDRADRDRYGKAVTQTDWYPVGGTYVKELDELVWAAEPGSGDDPAGLEPYDTESCRAYDERYVSGAEILEGEKDLRGAWETVSGRRKESLPEELRVRILEDKNCHHVKELKSSIAWTGIAYARVLLPVWIYRRTYRGRTYTVLENGETGSLTGRTPVSPARAAACACAVLGALALLAIGVHCLMRLFA